MFGTVPMLLVCSKMSTSSVVYKANQNLLTMLRRIRNTTEPEQQHELRTGSIKHKTSQSQIHEYNALDHKATDEILKAYAQFLHNDRRGTVATWHNLLNEVKITKHTDAHLLFAKIHDMQRRMDEFYRFLHLNSHHLQSSLPEPQHEQQLCALIETLHTRISSLENKLN
jgi:hypothetical protein